MDSSMDNNVARIAKMESNDFIFKQGYHCKHFFHANSNA